MTGVDLISEERKRQVREEGFTAKHDYVNHLPDELAAAGAVYALPEKMRLFYKGNDGLRPLWWPFASEWYKPTPEDRKRELVKAGALIAAEIDRIIDEENFERWKQEKKGKDI